MKKDLIAHVQIITKKGKVFVFPKAILDMDFIRDFERTDKWIKENKSK